MDSDSDGVIKVDQVVRVIELLGRQQMEMTPKEMNQVIDMLQKEEMMQIESHLEKVLVKETGGAAEDKKKRKKQKQKKKASAVKKASSIEDKELLRDTAKDLTEQQPEEHIREMFASPSEAEEGAEDDSPPQRQKIGMKASEGGAAAPAAVQRGPGPGSEAAEQKKEKQKQPATTSGEKPPMNLK